MKSHEIPIWYVPAKQDNKRNFEIELEIAFDLDILQAWSTNFWSAFVTKNGSFTWYVFATKYVGFGQNIQYHYIYERKWCIPAKQDNKRNFETKLEIAFDLDVLQGWSTRRLKAEILYFPSLKSIKWFT